MKSPIQKFRQSFIIFNKSGILCEDLKTLASSNYPTVQYFLLKLRTLPTYQCLRKGVQDFLNFV